MLKWQESMAFCLPLTMMQAYDRVAEFSVRQTELWYRAVYAPATQLFGAMWPSRAAVAEMDSATEIDEIRAQLRADAAERSASQAAAAARFDHLRDEISTLRDELNVALGQKGEAAEIQQLHADLNALREQVRKALVEREVALAESAATLSDLQSELRALRDRMDSRPAPAQETPAAGPGNETSRKRPRR
jgi:hypothetical protein